MPSYKCGTCSGDVATPKWTRKFTLDDVRATHEQTCPGRFRGRKDNK